ncbi:MAG: flagellar hook-associated protein FlgL, partial [Motiliproteus sp.]
MRISTQQIFNNGVSNMQKAQTALARTQEQVSTGKNLNRPSDDPVAAAQILKYRRELAATGTFQENITVSQRRLELEELTLQQVNDAGDRLKELAIRGNNSTMTNENRKGIAAEAKQIQQFVLGLMNTKDAQGEYLFSGARGDTEPFVSDSNGNFSYKGDSEVRFIQTGPSAMIQSTDSGRSVFQTVPGDMAVTLLNSSTVPTTGQLPDVPAGFKVSVEPATLPETTSDFETWVKTHGKQDLTLTVTGGVGALPHTYTLTGMDTKTGAVVTL